MSENVHLYPMQIKECHLDTFGHVNNAMYLAFFEEARWELVTNNGYGLKRIQETGIGPVILEVNLVFSKELHLRDNIIIETRLASVKGKIFIIEHRILRGSEVCCTAVFKLAQFDLNQRKIIDIVPEWLKAMTT